MVQTQARKDAEGGDDWMSLSEAAETLGEHRQTVLTRGIKGEVEIKHIAGRTIVSRASVARVREQKENA